MDYEKTLTLRRSYLDNGTFGKLFYKGKQILYTVERPELNNEKNISCIPLGVYSVESYHSEKHPDCYILSNKNKGVTKTGPSQRTHCLIHVANFVRDVEGCIGVGTEQHSTHWGVAHSRVAMNQLRQIIGGADGWTLVIE